MNSNQTVAPTERALLPCPFCGDDGEKGVQQVTQMIEGRNSFNRIICRCCGAMCPEANWPRRASALSAASDGATKLQVFRDAVLNGRGHLEAPCLDNDQTNAVLRQFDDTFQGDALASGEPK